MKKYSPETVDLIREQVEKFVANISKLTLSLEMDAKIDKHVDDMERELAKDHPDIKVVRDLVVMVTKMINAVRRPTLH